MSRDFLIVIGMLLVATSFLLLLTYSPPQSTQDVVKLSSYNITYLVRENHTYTLRENILLKNELNISVDEFIYVGMPLNTSNQECILISSTLKAEGLKRDMDNNPILVFRVSLLPNESLWLNLTFNLRVLRYRLKYSGDVPWPSKSLVDECTPKRFWPVYNQTFIRLAKDIALDAKNPIDAAYKVSRWILDHLEYTVSRRKGGEHALIKEMGHLKIVGDCEEVADVFTTIMRIIGIKSRVVKGLMLIGRQDGEYYMWIKKVGETYEYSDNWGGHAWPQFYIEDFGWIDVELLEGPDIKIGDLSEYHVKFNIEDRMYTGSTISGMVVASQLSIMLEEYHFIIGGG
ncbi:MAG TPA: transglutaminase domain-containing protein [Candidatus Bathyarchaeota archaeon]|nr:transglutaminase domain-containing protein [Candidatus Bathyarchaeota archaeon]